MFGWFKRIARRRSLQNILDLLTSLIEVSNRAYGDIQRFGDSRPEDRNMIHNLQTNLLIQLCGPLPLDRIKADIIEPRLAKPGMTEGARLAIDHVLKEFGEKNISWSRENYEAYEELLREFPMIERTPVRAKDRAS